MTEKNQLCHLLDDIETKQKVLSQCHEYYQVLEKEIEKKKQHLANPEDYEELEQTIAMLNREYDKKTDLLHEELNASLIKGHDLAKKFGHEIGHDFKKLWDYMTNSARGEVKLDHVQRDIEFLRKELP